MNQLLLQTSWWIPFYGLIGAVLSLPWSTGLIRRTGPRPAAYLNILMTTLAVVHGLLLFNATLAGEPQQLIFPWFHAADLNISFALNISSVSVGAMELVTGMSLLAQIFALGYMEKDWAMARFLASMGFFESAMSGIAISDSLFLTYGLLEILTLSTYLLVGFWYAQPLVVTAARDAFLTKRVGDLFLLMAVVTLATLAGSLHFPDLYDWVETAQLTPIAATLLGLGLISGPISNCAQFPLHLWLDEAMEAPAPASQLRNSIVVGCGAYVLIKLQPILVLSPVALTTLVVLGVVTSMGASFVALAQVDNKRALSHSTSAYMGLVLIAVGMQWTGFALLLLFTHAIAKALMFMSIGAVSLTTNSQDLTEMGGLASRMPATTAAYVVGAAGLIGLFPLGGFWAMRQGINAFWFQHQWLIPILLLVNCLTAVNLVRVFRLLFLGEPRPKTRRAPEVGWPLAVPMVGLTLFTLLLPLILEHLSLLPHLAYINWGAVGLLTLSGLIGVIIGGRISLYRMWARPLQAQLRFLQDLLAYDFYIDRAYHYTLVNAVALMARISAWLDRNIIDGVVNLTGLGTIFSAESLKYNVTGQTQLYALVILVAITILGLWMNWSSVGEIVHLLAGSLPL